MDTRPTIRTPLFCSLNYVPSTRVTTLLFYQAFLLFFSSHINCSRELLEPTSSYLTDDTQDNILKGTYFSPTPPLRLNRNVVSLPHRDVETTENGSLSPNTIHSYGSVAAENQFSPVFDFQLIAENYGLAPSRIQPRDLASTISSDETTDMWMDSLSGSEPGSGEVWDEHQDTLPGDESSPSAGISPTSMSSVLDNYSTIESTTAMDEASYNRAPVLNRRLPKLSLVSGQIWKYQIPSDTFIDEDGDLRSLWSSMFIKTGADSMLPLAINEDSGNGSSSSSLDRYFSWIQYNQSSHLLYALPTENNAGKHELVLVVSDKWSATGRESLELHVKQHLSVRAFTHLVSVDQVKWVRQKYPSIVDVLIKFIERLSERIFLTKNTKDFIIKSYTINDFSINSPNDHETTSVVATSGTNTEKQTTSLSISWSNSSLPVYPCDLNLLDSYLKHMVEGSVSLSSQNQPTSNLNPSAELTRAMYPDFTLSNISVDLRASCEGITGFSGLETNLSTSSINSTNLRVRVKIGMLTWKLGEPIEYHISSETFELEGSNDTKSIQMSLYTIDGLLLNKDSKYGFLEFDEETNTLFGMPYDMKQHSGQRELMLTAIHPPSGSRAREVFMLNIEPQELTMINNRAFKMSLYFGIRVEEFGPQERILLIEKIVQALRVSSWHEYRLDSPQIIITEIQKFFIAGDYSGSLEDFPQSQLARLVKVADEEALPAKENASSQHRRYFYKLSWTNSSIGVRGDCPVEVIKENIFFALEQSMLDLEISADIQEDGTKNDSTRFYERLRLYFDPEFDLMHLRFEPLGACQDAIELHEAGNSEIAESVDKLLAIDLATSELYHQQQEPSPPHLQLGAPKIVVEPDSDEYWSIVVLIVLVMVLIFVIVMFFLGIHTYKINQDKKFELQLRLAQARHNSMYLSSMILANQATVGAQLATNEDPLKNSKSMYVIHDENKKQRKPALVLDSELKARQQQLDMQSSTLGGPLLANKVAANGHLANDIIQNHPFPLIKSSATLTQMHPGNLGWPVQQLQQQHPSSSFMMDDKRVSMTLNRRFSNSIHQKLVAPSGMNHSQSILTVASVGCPVSLVSNVPMVYAHGAGYQTVIGHQPVGYLSQQHQSELIPQTANDSIKTYAQQQAQHNKSPLLDSIDKSTSYSSSASGTTQSVIMNPYYTGTNR